MNGYNILKIIHITTAFISIAGFFIRGIWMMQSSATLHKRWARIAPHVNDALLLLSAIALVFITAQYPGPAIWINVKIIALVFYIVLGTIALKRGRTMGIRVISWCLAILTFAYIMVVAFSKSALPI